MQVVTGKPIMQQIVAGRLCFYRRPSPSPQLYNDDNWRGETSRFHRAQQIAIRELNDFYIRAREEVGETVASIFKIHSMLLEDRNYVETVRSFIQNKGVTAEYAVQMAEGSFSSAFSAMDSHTSMLVQAYRIPAIVDVRLPAKWEGHLALMDCFTGTIYLDPEPAQQNKLRERYQANGCPVQYAAP